MPLGNTPSRAVAEAAAAGFSPRFVLHSSASEGVTAAWRASSERALFKAMLPYEAKGKADEGVHAAVARAVGGMLSAAGKDVPAAAVTPALLAMPLESVVEAGVAAALEEGGSSSSSSSPPLLLTAPLPPSQAASALTPALPPGLTATEDTLRHLYLNAFLSTRRLAFASALAGAHAEHGADAEMAARGARKVKHVGLRCAAAFFSSASLLSLLHAQPFTLPPSAAQAMTKQAPPPEPARHLLATAFSAKQEAPLLYAQASALSVVGELVLTRTRLYFYASVLGFVTKRAIPIDAIVGALPSHSGLGFGDGTLTVTYVDDDKIAAGVAAAAAAAAKKGAAAASAAAAAAAAAPTPAAKQSASLTSTDDLFANLMLSGSSSSSSSSSSSATPAAAPAPAVTISSTEPLSSVADAFGDLCELEGSSHSQPLPAAAAAPAAAPAASAATPATAPPKAAPAPASTALHPMLALLSSADLTSFMASGGSVDSLSQIHITPRAPVDRDGLYFVLQLLRQLESRPHLRAFDFSLSGTALGAEAAKGGAGAPLPGLAVPDYYAWLCEQHSSSASSEPPPPKPFFLLAPGDRSAMSTFLGQDKVGGSAGGSGAKQASAAASTLDVDLFAMPAAAQAPLPPVPAAATAAAAAAAQPAVSGYGDLESLAGAGDI